VEHSSDLDPGDGDVDDRITCATGGRSMTISRRDLMFASSLFLAALAIRLIFAAQLVFPPLDDPAFYLQTARNLAAGRGMVSDVIWNYLVPFTSVTHFSHEYWMPLATWLMAPFIKLLGDTLLVAQLPGIICGALLTPLTYSLARLAWPTDRDRVWAALAAILLLGGAVPVYQSASTDSAAPFALCAGAALISGGLALERRSIRWSCVAGLWSGLAYLARSDGLLIPALVGLGLASVALRRRGSWLSVVGLLGTAALVIGPWWLRNLAVFGATQPVSPGMLIGLQNYGQLFNTQNVPGLDQLLARGWPFVVDLRLQALSHNLSTWLLITFPFGLLGLPGLWHDPRPTLRLGFIHGILLLVTTALVFSVPTLMGLFYHSAAATLPWLAVGSVLVVRHWARRWRSVALAVSMLLVSLIVAQSLLAWPTIIADSRANQMKFEAAANWLRSNVPPDRPIITNEAHSLNYASGYPTLTLPNQEDPAMVAQLADRYGAHYVVMLGSVGMYPAALDRSELAIKRLAEGDVSIYELR
jgi:4-amino-4-deoxy-L-arabinose transferase-like glycosyltransferase